MDLKAIVGEIMLLTAIFILLLQEQLLVCELAQKTLEDRFQSNPLKYF